jgi:hypothetical protein
MHPCMVASACERVARNYSDRVIPSSVYKTKYRWYVFEEDKDGNTLSFEMMWGSQVYELKSFSWHHDRLHFPA